MIGSDGDEDVQACFPCPFCYVEIEVPVLYAHLQEKHCFDVKNSMVTGEASSSAQTIAENQKKRIIRHSCGRESYANKVYKLLSTSCCVLSQLASCGIQISRDIRSIT